ncbi:major facilitator superfamily domain-containing protein [Irpex rosettiformis]|uniref:Major facilitator superfamily domain-containing protein n=1 Tax=Irpex rosettiformis TaxID=378272 RepID=A0ACB8TU99_9APHY|nr:major facilitator superfamily domain-containing protein [Irpex rosettiformis]
MDAEDQKNDKTGLQDIKLCSRSVETQPETPESVKEPLNYRLYRRRFVGLLALVVLNIVGGFSSVWFGSITGNTATEFGFTAGQVNWLSNVLNLVYLPASVAATFICKKWGVCTTCYIGSVFLVISAWVRYAGTARSISTNASLCLLMLGQLAAGIAQPAFQVIGPFYSETWFGLKSRTTVTMIIGVANPFGTGISQIISPLAGSVRTSILVLGIVSTVATPFSLLMSEVPPTPPTHSATQRKPSFLSLMRALTGREPETKRTYMTLRERLDFLIITLIFGVFVGVVTSFSILTSQDFEPYGYSSDTAGFFGATLFLVGLLMAGITSPIFDRVLTRHLALTCKVFCPLLGILWLCMIWAVKPHNTGALYAIMAIIGGLSLPILPAALELAVEVTRNADASSAILWSAGNLITVIFVLSENALRAGPEANPPFNMHRAIIFEGVFALSSSVMVFALQGKQTRRELDEQRMQEARREDEIIEQVIS